jgi:hypothetical protein
MLLAGMVALGIVWGWLAGGALARRRWRDALVTLAGAALQGSLLPAAVAGPATAWYAVAATLGACVHLAWLRGLRRVRP